MRKISIIPSLITLCNLICGLGAVWYAFKYRTLQFAATTDGWVATSDGWITTSEGALKFAAMLIFLGMIFDVLDGRIARMTNSTSNFGKELDSLSDFLTFGIAPAILIEVMSEQSDAIMMVIGDRGRMVLSAAYVIFAALRLARYNAAVTKSPDHSSAFSGLPSPAAAGFIAGLVLVQFKLVDFAPAISNIIRCWAPVMAFLIGILMVSNVKFLHVGDQFVRSRLSFRKLVLFAITIVFLLIFPPYVLFSTFTAYVLVGVIAHFLKKSPTKKEQRNPGQ